jgi:hypothetical protein
MKMFKSKNPNISADRALDRNLNEEQLIAALDMLTGEVPKEVNSHEDATTMIVRNSVPVLRLLCNSKSEIETLMREKEAAMAEKAALAKEFDEFKAKATTMTVTTGALRASSEVSSGLESANERYQSRPKMSDMIKGLTKPSPGIQKVDESKLSHLNFKRTRVDPA